MDPLLTYSLEIFVKPTPYRVKIIALPYIQNLTMNHWFCWNYCIDVDGFFDFFLSSPCNNRLVMDAIIILTLVEEMQLKMPLRYIGLLILKECTRIWLIGDGCCYFTDISRRDGISWCIRSWHMCLLKIHFETMK